MNLQTYFYTLAAIFLFSWSQSAAAQTCRVNTGTLDNGFKVYAEVFEYDYVDVKPEFPGGGRSLIKFVNENRQYPQEAYNNGIEGRVTCSFVVNSDGHLSNIQVLRGVEPSLNDEALRIIAAMPNWSPGSLQGQLVPVRVVCCIPFRR